jgi:hypothetical protein
MTVPKKKFFSIRKLSNQQLFTRITLSHPKKMELKVITSEWGVRKY